MGMDEPVRASSAEKETLDRIHKLLDAGELSFYSHVDDAPIEIPESVSRALVLAVEELAAGNALSIAPLRAELTPRQAAELLGVSRPYFVRLLNEDVILSHTVGTHHRIYLEDVLAYKRSRDQTRREGLDELARRSQGAGLG